MRTLARQGDRDEIVRRLRTVGPTSVRRWGRMSPHQMVCHLSDAFRMAMGQMEVSPATSLLYRTVVKGIALYLPLRWPPGILTRPEVDQECGGTRPTDFANDVATLEALIDVFVAAPRDFAWAAHPFFGRMSATAWLRWGYLHCDHHLRQFGA